MLTLNDDTRILLDSDVIRHLIKGERLSLLCELYGSHLILLDVVRDELLRSKQLETIIENFIKFNKIEVRKFPSDNMNILKEFAILKKRYGLGESACMAVAKYENTIIVSSNLKDIKTYCEKNSFMYLTTIDILMDAIEKSVLSEDECDQIIQKIKSRNSKLPVNSISEYRKLKT
jgi:predicted nucleic acid-binding protein